MKPAALGVVERNRGARATCQAPERLAEGLSAHVPKGDVHGGEGEAGDRPDRCSVSGPEELLPDGFDLVRILAGQQGDQVVPKHFEHGPPPSSNRVRVAGANHAVGSLDVDEDRLLLREALDRVGARSFWNQVDEVGVDSPDWRFERVVGRGGLSH